MKNNLEQLKRIKNIINNNKTNPNISLLLTLSLLLPTAGCSNGVKGIDNSTTIPEIVGTISDISTVDEYLNSLAYTDLESQYVEFRMQGGTDKTKLNDAADILANYGLNILKGSVLESLNIPVENVNSIQIAENQGVLQCNINYREYNEVLRPGNITVIEMTEKDDTYTLKGWYAETMYENICLCQNKTIESVDDVYLFYEEFLLTSGEYNEQKSYSEGNKKVKLDNVIEFDIDKQKQKKLVNSKKQ